MGVKSSKYKSSKICNKKKNKLENKQITAENKFNCVKARYIGYGSEVTNKKLKYSYTYNGVPGGWYIE